MLKRRLAAQAREGADLDLLLRAIAHPIRREIVWLVWDQQLTAGELAARFNVTAPTVSQHLKLLREVGLVNVVADRAYRRYSARTERMAALRAALRPGTDHRHALRQGVTQSTETAPCWELVLRLSLATSPALAYRYFTEADHMAAWLGPKVSSDPRPGGTSHCGFPTGEQVRTRFLHLVPGELLLAEWDYENDPTPPPGPQPGARPTEPRGSQGHRPAIDLGPRRGTAREDELAGNRVIVSFHPAALGTEVEIRHLSYTPGSVQLYETAWGEYLARLQAAVVHAGHPEP